MKRVEPASACPCSIAIARERRVTFVESASSGFTLLDIYKEWPALDTPGVINRIGEALTALDVCKKAGDVLGPVKLLATTEKHFQRIEKEAERLNPEVNIDHEKPAAAQGTAAEARRPHPRPQLVPGEAQEGLRQAL